MLRRLSANHDSFAPLTFTDGFNVILAHRSPDATEQHSRNARGKTTVLQIISYCLGGNLPAALKPLVEHEWTFTLDLDLFGGIVSVTRALRGGTRVTLAYSGDPAAVLDNYVDEARRTSLDNWKFLLGLGLFSLDAEAEEKAFRLSPRTLISYIIRLEALRDPLKIVPAQPAWSSREHVSYLLGLEWRHVRSLTKIAKETDAFKALEYAASENLLPGTLGNEPELLLARAQAAREVEELRSRIGGFQIIDDPDRLLQLADSLTEQLRELRDESLIDRRLLDLYRTSIQETDGDSDAGDLRNLYTEMGAVFNESALQRLEDVQAFHVRLISNRRTFLQSEISALETAERHRQAAILQATQERGRAMAVLQAGGALEELNALYVQLNEASGHLTEIDAALNTRREIAAAKDDAEVRRAQVRQIASAELRLERGNVESLSARFGRMMLELYNRTGVLTASVDDFGYKFSLRVSGAASSGITRMQLLCFDLALLAENSDWIRRPNFLVHDSVVFDGVDPRQIATALDLAQRTANELGAQYICTMNSSDVPDDVESQEWFRAGVRRTVLDTDEGGILGVAF
jgi:uncharacterized protein YydD (DUF2326 family)